MDFKFQSLGKISNISAADPLVLLGEFQHCIQPLHCAIYCYVVNTASRNHSHT